MSGILTSNLGGLVFILCVMGKYRHIGLKCSGICFFSVSMEFYLISGTLGYSFFVFLTWVVDEGSRGEICVCGSNASNILCLISRQKQKTRIFKS